ncbi:conserved oligomeric Golgi complex subunit 2 isoform X1 [Rhagoletis pomonella]|uniref:conserved oligomeric Golgi complex subunit 2 isoform X1 n=1 Tax=Rhagoletis pomonella TaxID=28610 RepID=UPI001781E73E|nr:conserved oligomeric Golgi complex subunit 2 isoform X1 [Rhagoletis pomonella]
MKDQTTYLPANSHGFTNGEGNKNSTILCFDKNDFMKGNFSVDEFLHKNRNAPSLEQLRDDLGIYLKDLRASMIDLINEDYADFVSLSANLVGLDQSIANIENPVLQFRKEVDNIRFCVKECAAAVSDNLKKKQKLREEKRNLQCHQKVQEAINKLSRLLEHQLKEKLNPFDVERAALELIQLQFNRQFCLEILNDEQKKNIERLEKEVLAKLRISFSDALKGCSSKCSDLLERCLRIYITLDACQIAEQVFREDIVAPYMSTIISEHCLQNSPQGLSGIYGKALNFISLYMTDLLRLTHYTDKLCGFNFLINSFWVDVEMRLETYMPSIFAPGNSEVFYVKYKCTRDFLSKIEELLANDGAVKSFREHKQTISFQARWNLPVYFQICFQEIAGEFESILDPLLHSVSLSPKEVVADSTFQLATFDSASKAIDRCWMEGVYLKEIFPKFLKLNLQILLRLSRWVQDAIQLITNGDLKSNSLREYNLEMHKSDLLIALYADLQKLIENMPQIQQNINENIPSEVKSITTVYNAIGKSFNDLRESLNKSLFMILDALVDILVFESGIENVRQVKDLPRLYRKTNREIPSKPSAYVDQILRPLKSFQKQKCSQMGKMVAFQILKRVCSKITKEYYVEVTDVLTSVQKTEESLRRLRNLKSGTSNAFTTGATAMSDDDKIRLQLHVDVITWTGELAKLGLMPSDVENLFNLNDIVEASSKIKGRNDNE